MSWYDISRWPAVVIFAFAGTAGAGFALITVNLFNRAVASLGFLREHGAEAIAHGALWQVAELLGWGALSLLCWLAFKISEHALEERYFAWVRRRRARRRKTTAPDAAQAPPTVTDK